MQLVSAAEDSRPELTADACRPTADHVEGPFYRPGAPDRDDLYPEDSSGPVLLFEGKVQDRNCTPLPAAVIEVWQADDRGRYDNDDPTTPPPPGSFRCRGRMRTDREGRFRFRTVVPANYPVPGTSWLRVKHVHFKLYAEGYRPLTTEVELLPDQNTETDLLYNPDLSVMLTQVDGAQIAPLFTVRFDFVLDQISAAAYALAARSWHPSHRPSSQINQEAL
jgi:protocatechuate 3,4-dioxygenase beta subunit